MRLDAEIDRLYQVPLGEFTSARSELATRAGKPAPEIKKLAKPSLVAWAVNQLYWHRRKLFDRLMTAAQRVRAAHVQQLGGKKADIAGVELAHRAALREATNEIVTLLQQARETASPATMTAVGETLQALPNMGSPGRLTQPLKLSGFEALAGLKLAAPSVSRPADVVAFRHGAREPKREAAAEKRETAKLEKALAEARAGEQTAARVVTRSRAALARAEQDQRRLLKEADAKADEVQRLREDVARHQQDATAAAAERSRLEQQLEGSHRG